MLDKIARICFIVVIVYVLSTLILDADKIESWQSIEISLICIIGSLILEIRAALKKIWEKLDKDVSIK